MLQSLHHIYRYETVLSVPVHAVTLIRFVVKHVLNTLSMLWYVHNSLDSTRTTVNVMLTFDVGLKLYSLGPNYSHEKRPLLDYLKYKRVCTLCNAYNRTRKFQWSNRKSDNNRESTFL